MYLSVIASIVGILFLIAGAAGFVPGFFKNGMLFGLFYVDTIHNVVNFIIGIIALFSSLKYKRDRLFFQVFGILFGILAIVGFVWQGNLIFTVVNWPDTILHLILAVIFLILGFSAQKEGRV